MRRFRPRLTYANVTATLALFIALGGSGYAALKLPRNSVGTSQLKRHAVTTSKIAAGAVTASRVRANSLTGNQINEGSLGKVPSAATADSAAVAVSLGGVSAAQLKVRCPAGTTAYQAACVETVERRSATDWQTANEDCAFDGRRLPTAAELSRLTRVTGLAFAGTEWTGDAVSGLDALTSDDFGGLNSHPMGSSEPYRCVASATN